MIGPRKCAEDDGRSLTGLIALCGAAVLAAMALSAIVSGIAKKRLIRRISRCVDSLQRALPTIEQASQMYIDARLDDGVSPEGGDGKKNG